MSKKIIFNLFNYALSENASGFVIESEPEKINLNYLFHSGEERSFNLPKKLEKNLTLTLKKILKLSPDELVSKKYCKLERIHSQLSFHLTIIPSKLGEKIIINITPKSQKIFNLKQLGMRSLQLKKTRKNLNCSSGLIIVSSPANQGKSSCLYSLLKEIDTEKRSAYFIGGKMEFELKNISNLTNTKDNWAKVLNTDSQIIATEINNEENLKNAIYGAASGRLVIATFEANSVWDFLNNYLKLKLPLRLKLDNLKFIINQRVTPLKRGNLEKLLNKKNKRRAIGLFEVLEITDKIKNSILETKNNKIKEKFWEKLLELATQDGYESLAHDKSEKNKNSLID